MELVFWLAAGAAAGWLSIVLLRLNHERGQVVSMLIGAVGAAAGGTVLAPLFGADAAMPGDFSLPALIVAVATAGACLALGNILHQRYGV